MRRNKITVFKFNAALRNFCSRRCNVIYLFKASVIVCPECNQIVAVYNSLVARKNNLNFRRSCIAVDGCPCVRNVSGSVKNADVKTDKTVFQFGNICRCAERCSLRTFCYGKAQRTPRNASVNRIFSVLHA